MGEGKRRRNWRKDKRKEDIECGTKVGAKMTVESERRAVENGFGEDDRSRVQMKRRMGPGSEAGFITEDTEDRSARGHESREKREEKD